MDATRRDVGALADLPEAVSEFLPETPTPERAAAGDATLRKKELRRLGESRRLEPWERYRALNDAMDEVYELMDHSNREARFALLVMGILNAFVIISASRPEVVGWLSTAQRTIAAILLGIYAVTAMYFLYQAIESLHPGKFRPQSGTWAPDEMKPMGVRYYEDVIDRDVHEHWRAWHDVQIGQLNAEMAMQFHTLCVKADVKRIALQRLFGGLRLMTMLVAAMMVLFVYASWV